MKNTASPLGKVCNVKGLGTSVNVSVSSSSLESSSDLKTMATPVSLVGVTVTASASK